MIQFDNALTEEDGLPRQVPPEISSYAERIRYFLAGLLAIAGGYLVAVNIALRIGV